jgi:transcription elongation factor Elf1
MSRNLAFDDNGRPIRCPVCQSESWRRNTTETDGKVKCLRCGVRYEVELSNTL